jgi:hypothetical protein
VATVDEAAENQTTEILGKAAQAVKVVLRTPKLAALAAQGQVKILILADWVEQQAITRL